MEIPYEVTARPDTGLYNAKIGIWLFLASEVMLFGAIFTAYLFVRLGAEDGTWPDHIQNVALGFTNTLRKELRPKGIRVIALMPGATDTAIWNTLWPKAPRKNMMSPATVAAAVVNAILLPPNTTIETLELLPTSGRL